MTTDARTDAIRRAQETVDSGEFERVLAARVAHRTESQRLPESLPALRGYLVDELIPAFTTMGFQTDVIENPIDGAPPALRQRDPPARRRALPAQDGGRHRAESVAPALRRHLDAHGFERVRLDPPPAGNAGAFPARRTDPDHPWAIFVRNSIATTVGAPPAVLPSIGGSVPNHVFTDLLGLPTIWIPHSYPSCSQHAPNEHVLTSTCRSGPAVMAGIFVDTADQGGPLS